MRRFVVGFLFDTAGSAVVLVEKRRPAWQAGRFNGVGGKVEDGEEPEAAMVREFREETGLEVTAWALKVVLHGVQRDWEVRFYASWLPLGRLTEVRSLTDEKVSVAHTWNLPGRAVSNLRWIIPFCLDSEVVMTAPVLDLAPSQQFEGAPGNGEEAKGS